MTDLDSEIARLQAEINNRKFEADLLRQQEPQPNWDDDDNNNDHGDDDDEYSEESYYEEEIIEEYSEDEWEEEIIEEEIIEEEIIEDDDDEEMILLDNTVVMTEAAPTQQPVLSSIQSTEVNTDTTTSTNSAAAAPLITRRTWTPSSARAPAPAPIVPEPATTTTPIGVPKWKRSTPPPSSSIASQEAAKSSSSVPSWATKQQSKMKKTSVPIISSTSETSKSTSIISSETRQTNPTPISTSSSTGHNSTTSASPSEKPIPRNKAKVRPPPGANGQVVVKNTPPPGLDTPTEKKGPRVRIINWGSNRRTNTTIQSMTQPNFKPGVPGTTATEEPAQIKRNYVIPKNVQRPQGGEGGMTTTVATKGGHKRRPIPDINPSPAGEETLWEQLLGPKLIANSKLQKKNTVACMKDQELIGLYFGCAMKSDCKMFHPRLQDFYFNTSSGQQNMEIVYISSDRSLTEFKELYAKMPYLALPGGTACYKNKLSQSFKIIDQPTLVILDEDGMIVTVDAVNQIMALERGNIEQANALVERWKKTRPVSIDDIQRDFALQYGKLQRGVLYWQE